MTGAETVSWGRGGGCDLCFKERRCGGGCEMCACRWCKVGTCGGFMCFVFFSFFSGGF